MRKIRTLYSLFLATGLLAFAATLATPAAAEDCPRSFLDEQYCDRDANLTADLPQVPVGGRRRQGDTAMRRQPQEVPPDRKARA